MSKPHFKELQYKIISADKMYKIPDVSETNHNKKYN